MRKSIKPIAVITGAARGIGRGIARTLASEGFDIIGIDIAWQSELTDSTEFIETNGAIFHRITADISDTTRHDALISSIIEKFGRIDILVNNAGVATAERLDILDTTAESFDRVLSINLRGTFFLTQRVARAMLECVERIPDIRPKIVFITSISAEVSSIDRAEYCISKVGLSMAARVFADRLSDTGIGVFEIRPGIIQTDMTEPVKSKYDKLIAEGLVPQRRWGQPEDVAKVVAAIARGSFDYSTGMIFEVSGGMNIVSL